MRSAIGAALLGGICCISALTWATRVASAEQSTLRPASTDPARQAELRSIFYGALNDYFRAAIAAQRRGDCEVFRFHISELSKSDSDRIRQRAREEGVFLPPAQRQEILRRRAQLLAQLRRLDCPPRTAVQRQAEQAVQTATQLAEQAQQRAAQLQLGAGASSTNGLTTRNGGLGVEQSATGPSEEFIIQFGNWGSISPEVAFSASHGSGTRTQSNVFGGVLNQWNGGTQDTSGAGNASYARSNVETTQVDAELLFGIEHALLPDFVVRERAGTWRPFLGVGYGHFRLKTNLFARWQPIDFNVNSSSTTEVNRGSFIAGFSSRIPISDNSFFFWEFKGRANVDSVTASGSYLSTQFGSPLGPAANGSDSKTAFTLGARVTGGLGWNLAGGARLEARTFVASDPVPQFKAHFGRTATIEYGNQLTAGGGLNLRVPLVGPRPFDFFR